ncbi:MAG TPA: MIP/aquaporin family protein [Casimicrobiaceae bacterium]|nr:MIP/aquaporin family protein [Casimicrobiaceae bacterium]
MTLARRLTAEAIGTAFLLAVIVGSGIMGERLAGGNSAIALLANSIATGCGLWVLITLFGPISGAHFNPAVTLAFATSGEFAWRDVFPYVLVQIAAAYVGVAAAHLMFDLPLFTASTHVRAGPSQWWSEVVATLGLLLTIWLGLRMRPQLIGGLVAVYITGAYWFTASTSFANPAVTLARAATNTFSGIRPADVPGFVAAELAGALLATPVARWLCRAPRRQVAKPENPVARPREEPARGP